MPQMMPCSWLMIFLGGVFTFLVMSSCWGSFFVLSSFPVGDKSLFKEEKMSFWV